MNPLVETFQNFRRILCICPCCQQMRHLSDLHLKYKGKAPKTWLDTYESNARALDEKEAKFDEKEKEIRDKATERGRKKVDQILTASLESSLAQFKYNPYDIKAILHPVDFIVFDGLNSKEKVDDVTFLCKTLSESDLIKTQKEVENVVKAQKYDWKVARVEAGGTIEYE